jgi:membrane protein DedA with SNARE-associated domain
VLIYFVSMKVCRAAIVRFGRRLMVSEQDVEKAEKWFAKYGPAAVFTARMISGIREIISIYAGIGRMNFTKFVANTFAGSLVWCIVLPLESYYLGEAWSEFSEQASYAFAILGLIVVAAMVAGIGVWYARRGKGKALQRAATRLPS